MKLGKAIRYFFQEALRNLGRSFRVSLLAVLTIAISLFLGGTFLLAGLNLKASVERWQKQVRLILYLQPGAAAQTAERLAAEVRQVPFAASVEVISAELARQRFREAFPSMSDLLEGWDQEPLPPSLEITLAAGTRAATLEPWLAAWRKRPEISMIDDDREWLRQLQAVVTVVRTVGLLLGGILLGAAGFTIASVIRLTAYLNREEIGVMRLVGATEFFIRGPFYVEGLLQGLFGGVLASTGLYLGYRLLKARAGDSLLSEMLAARFLESGQVAMLVAVGALAGLLGAILSLRREPL